MLHRGTDAGQEDEREQAIESVGKSEPYEGDPRGHGAERQEPALAPFLGEQAGRDLQQRRCRPVCRPDQRNFRIGKPKSLAQQRQQRIQHVHETIVENMYAAAGRQGEFRLRLAHFCDITS